MLSIVSFEKQYKINNAFKYLISIHLKSSITKYLPKLALWVNYLGYLGDIIWYISCISVYKIYIYLQMTASFFFLFQIKTCGFHLKEEGKELLGMLMAALANNNGYYVLYLFLLSPFKI